MIATPARRRRPFAAKRIEEMPGHGVNDVDNLHASAYTKTPLATRRQVRRAKNHAARAARRANRTVR